ncbi:MAG: hypothetical protein LBG83_02860 [Oscillospiraceae bacterium]|jgi:hypothetical protein|nr:hypothetical protein [Oscillospiraceae bacterium]
MQLELFRSAGSDACVITLRDTLDDGDVDWRFRLEHPLQLLLCFLNGDCAPLTGQSPEPLRAVQEEYFAAAFGRAGLGPLRELIEHVLVCAEPARGFDPIVRLAAYSYAQGLFELTRAASCVEKRSLEASVVGAKGAARMAENWAALLEDHAARLQNRDALFEALLADAANNGYPFELSVAAEYSSFAHLLKALTGEMIQQRRPLHRCTVCGEFALADGLPKVCACGQGAGPAEESAVGEIAGQSARILKRIYAEKANAARYGDPQAQARLKRFEQQVREWRQNIRRGRAKEEDLLAWLQEKAEEAGEMTDG